MTSPGKRRPGRPQKFGRTAEAITVRLPQDVITALSSLDQDLASAIVKLHEQSRQASKRRVELAGLYQIPGGRALILVRPEHFGDLAGVALIPLSDGRAFLALEPSKGVADLELAVLDRLEARALSAAKRTALLQLRGLLQAWRRDGIEFEARTIVVARRTSRRPRPLATLRSSD